MFILKTCEVLQLTFRGSNMNKLNCFSNEIAVIIIIFIFIIYTFALPFCFAQSNYLYLHTEKRIEFTVPFYFEICKFYKQNFKATSNASNNISIKIIF